jgi:hypothetical protein
VSEVSDVSEVSEVSGANSGRSVASILRSVIVRVLLLSGALSITASTPNFRKTDLAGRNRLPNEDTSRGHDFHFDGAASVRSRPSRGSVS